MIIPVYKPVGQSTHQLAQRVGSLRNDKATHTGTLDPMADGVIVVLVGDDRKRKTEFGHWLKTYRVEVLWGIETDSGDVLGLVSRMNKVVDMQVELPSRLAKAVPKLLGNYQRELPRFSARRLNGGTYFDFARRGTPFTLGSELVGAYSIEVGLTQVVLFSTVVARIVEKNWLSSW